MRRGRRRRGITLVELLVTALILGITAPALVLAAGTSERIGRTAQKRATAQTLAVAAIENFRNLCRSSSATAGTTTTSYAGLKLGTFTIQRVVAISGTLATCEVTVSWNETRGNGIFTDSVQLGTAAGQGS